MRLPPLLALAAALIATAAYAQPASLKRFIAEAARASAPSLVERYTFASADAHLPLGLRQVLVSAALSVPVSAYAEHARRVGDKVDILDLAGADNFAVATPDTSEGSAVIDFIVKHVFDRQ